MAACGRRGAGAIVACVWSCWAAEVLAGAPALRERGAYVPFERDEGLRPLGWARGAASVRLGAAGARWTARRYQAGHRGAAEPPETAPGEK